MKNRILYFQFILLLSISKTFAQTEDSTIVTKFTENFIEVKSTRVILSEGYSPKSDNSSSKDPHLLEGVYVRTSYVPRGPVLKNGLVVIKDRNNNILRTNYFVDSILVNKDFYTNNILESQSIFSVSDTSLLEKVYYKNGNLHYMRIREGTGPTIFIFYSETGEIIDKRVEEQ